MFFYVSVAVLALSFTLHLRQHVTEPDRIFTSVCVICVLCLQLHLWT
jgi:hypothetical protein